MGLGKWVWGGSGFGEGDGSGGRCIGGDEFRGGGSVGEEDGLGDGDGLAEGDGLLHPRPPFRLVLHALTIVRPRPLPSPWQILDPPLAYCNMFYIS